MKSFICVRFFVSSFFVINFLVYHRSTRANEHVTIAGFIFHPGLTLDPNIAYHKEVSSSKCKCRSLCLADQYCKAYTWISINDSVICSYFDKTFDQLSLIPDSMANTAISTDQFNFIGEDNLEYYLHPYEMDFPGAIMTCNALEKGYQLGIYKTMQRFGVLQKLADNRGIEIWVDMMVTDPYDGMWRDGTLYSATEIGHDESATFVINDYDLHSDPIMFRFVKDGFNDMVMTAQYSVLCQRIPRIQGP